MQLQDKLTMLTKWKTKRLMKPAGLFGRLYLGPMWNRRNVALNEAALDALAARGGDRILEIGFGGGYLLGRLAEEPGDSVLCGVDVSAAMIDVAAKHLRRHIASGRVTLHRGEAQMLPFVAQSFDSVVSVNSIFYWPDPSAGLQEINRVLAARGRLVLCLTEKESLLPKGYHRYGLKLFDENEIHELLETSGFIELEVKTVIDQYRRFLLITAKVR